MAVCLVTGGAGFIGSHLVEALVARGDHVRIVDDFSTGIPDNLSCIAQQVEVVVTDLGNIDVLCQAAKGVDCIFHYAGPPYAACEGPEWMLGRWGSASDTLNVLIAARKASVRRVLYASSGSIYGHTDAIRLKESDPVLPLSPYGFAKLSGEHFCVAFASLYGLETVRLRYFNVFGPRQHPSSPYAAAIPAIIKALLAGQSPVLLEDALAYQDFLYIDDAVHATLLAADASRSGRCYNIARGRPANLAQVVAIVNELLGTRIQAICSELQFAESPPRAVDISRAETELGFCPSIDLRQALASLIGYYTQQAEPAAEGTPGSSEGRRGPHRREPWRPPAASTPESSEPGSQDQA